MVVGGAELGGAVSVGLGEVGGGWVVDGGFVTTSGGSSSFPPQEYVDAGPQQVGQEERSCGAETGLQQGPSLPINIRLTLLSFLRLHIA